MKIVISSAEVEMAVAQYLTNEKDIPVHQNDIKWSEGFAHPVYPLFVEIK